MLHIAPGLLWILGFLFASLAIGSGIRVFALRNETSPAGLKPLKSLCVWWILLLLFASALVLGQIGLSILFCLAGLTAIKEFHEIYAKRSFDSPVLAISVGMMGILHYFLLNALSPGASWEFPLLVLVLLSTVAVFSGKTQDYLRATAGYFWAFVLLFFGVSHAVLLLNFPAASGELSPGTVGWCIFLVILTEINDIAQALTGRRFGKRKIVPKVSPGKSWEGLGGGICVTILLSMTLAPWLTSLTTGRAWLEGSAITAIVGLVISLCGFLGDVNMSALKREAGVKDSSHLLPGMGGMIDRLDSLTLAAPAFYYLSLAIV